jgi:hypothetical protein
LDHLCSKEVIDMKFNSLGLMARTTNGQLYCSTQFERLFSFIQHLSDKKIIDICCGLSHSLALTKSGEVYSWGYNWNGNGSDKCRKCCLTPIKLNAFNGEKVIQISCGLAHSMALTKSGRVFGWGNNIYGQLDRNNNNNDNGNKPSIVLLSNKNTRIQKISCGEYHSLLLSRDGDIYWFGFNGIETQITPKKLTINSSKFIDIASYYRSYICVALTEDCVYVWGKCNEVKKETEIISSKDLKQTQFKTIEQFYNNVFGITYKSIDSLEDLTIKTPIMENDRLKEFEQIKKLGEGHFGDVFRVKHKNSRSGPEWAMKKIEFTYEKMTSLLKEVQIFNTFSETVPLNTNIVRLHDIWLENNRVLKNGNKNGLILYIVMELCDVTLETVINQMLNDRYICENNTLTLLGFYIASRIFVEILEGVNRLHKHQIFHCDLHSENILLKKDHDYKREKYEIHVKIVDFGLARICELAQKSETVLPKGNSKHCLSQVSSDGSYTLKADIYALEYIMRQLFCIDTFR